MQKPKLRLAARFVMALLPLALLSACGGSNPTENKGGTCGTGANEQVKMRCPPGFTSQSSS